MLRWAGAGAHNAQGKAEGVALVQSCKEKAKRGVLQVLTYLIVGYREDKARFFLELDTDGTKGNEHKFQNGNSPQIRKTCSS